MLNRSAVAISPGILEPSKIFQVGCEQTEQTRIHMIPKLSESAKIFGALVNPTFRETLKSFSVNFNDDNHRQSLHHRRSEPDKMVSF